MSFLSPIWLAALAPWVGVVLWQLWGRRPRVQVPFLRLWDGPVVARSSRRKIELPPWGIRFVLLAILLGLLAAAHPVVSRAGGRGQAQFTLILDRGITTSARGGKDLRFREAASELLAAIQNDYATATIELIPVPGERKTQIDLPGLSAAITRLEPTAFDTATQIREAIDAARTANPGPIVLISDQQFDLPRQVIQVSPASVVQDVAIVSIAARQSPRPEVMVKVRNMSSRASGEIKIESDGQTISRTIQFPPPGGEGDFFFDLPRLGPTITAGLVANDDQPADDTAWLVREGLAPRIEARAALPAELRRMIDIYQRHRPPPQDSAKLEMVAGEAQLSDNATGVIVASPMSRIDFSSPQVSVHPINEHVDWNQFIGQNVLAARVPPGWLPVLASGGQVLVAVRAQPSRQVWVGFDAPHWAGTTDYVVFWTNVFNWLGGGQEAYSGHPLNEWTPEWRNGETTGRLPGLYQRSDGVIRAFNPPDVRFPPPPHVEWRSRLGELSIPLHTIDLVTPVLIAALTCLVVAAIVWKKRHLPAGPTRTKHLNGGELPAARPLLDSIF